MRLWTLHPKYLDPKGLVALWRETLLAQRVLAGRTRGYRFDESLIIAPGCSFQIEETKGQLLFEWEHLRAKLATRCPEALQRFRTRIPAPNPLFRIVPGSVRTWEQVSP